MNHRRLSVRWLPAFFCALSLLCGHAFADSALHHYVFFAHERERIKEASFLETSGFEGAQLKYTWRELEPKKDAYDFAAIRHDLDFLKAHGKKLFIQLQETSFDPKRVLVPDYLRQEPEFHGGANPQYDYKGDDEKHAVAAGWVARRWDPAVSERFQKLLFALGKEFDGKIEGINLPETAVDFGESGLLFPPGFTPEAYRDSIITNMAALKRAFPDSVTMQYANFMPGEWLPWTDKGYLKSVYQAAEKLGVGVGGPDLLIGRKAQMGHAYPLISARSGIPGGIAVQDGNYGFKNPETKRKSTIPELASFARDYLKVNYMFWCTQEPYYSKEVVPFCRSSTSASLGKSENH